MTVMFATYAGSPFILKVTGPPDPNKVRVTGPGIRDGTLSASYQSVFWVHTKGAGAGELTVKIRGPKGKAVDHVLIQILGQSNSYCVAVSVDTESGIDWLLHTR
jgi:hypothetical protein